MAIRIRSDQRDKSRARDWQHAVLAALLLIFVAATSLSDGKLIPDFGSRESAVPQRAASADEDLRTGSILVTPRDGNICELRLIDNQTWRIRPAGQVQCDDAVTWHPHHGDGYTTQSRIEAIRDGFVAKR
jgi:hypothetical protein